MFKMKLDKSLAFQVVSTIKDTCGQDINFIDKQGIIFASTNADRIGTFHAVGHKAAQTEETIEVFSDDDFPGTQKGINMPLYYHGSFLAVIGITGEPDTVRQYVHLADRITHLLIREKELNRLSRSLEDKKHFVINALIRNEIAEPDYLDTCLSDLQVNPKTKKRLLIIQTVTDGSNSSSSLNKKIIGLFNTLGITLYTFYYPNEYLAVLENPGKSALYQTLTDFSAACKAPLSIAVGKKCPLSQLSLSYQSALTALKYSRSSENGIAFFDDMTLEILLSSIAEQEKNAYLQKTISALSDEEKNLLQTYFEEDMSLLGTSQKLFLHKNTVQYKLNHIYQKCGLNPRAFKDAVLLYLALQL